MNCSHRNRAWQKFMIPMLSFDFEQCMDCGELLGRKNIADLRFKKDKVEEKK